MLNQGTINHVLQMIACSILVAKWQLVPQPLEALYGGDPRGAMAFIRLKIE